MCARLFCALLLVPLALCFAAPPRAHAAGPVVTCDPLSARAQTTQDLSIDVRVNDVSGLYGVDIAASFDPAIAQVVDANSATGGVQIQPLSSFFAPDFVARNGADNTAGAVHYAAAQVAPTQPVSGSGPLFRLTFHPVAAGVFNVTFTLHELADIDGMLIANVAQTCTVEFQSPLAVELDGVEVRAAGGDALLSWETVSEIDHAGFNLYRAARAEQERAWIAFVPAAAPGSTAGSRYAYRVHPARGGDVYWLEAAGLSGGATRYGPYSAAAGVPSALTLAWFEGTPEPRAPFPVLGAGALLVIALFALAKRQLARCEARPHPTRPAENTTRPASARAGNVEERLKGG